MEEKIKKYCIRCPIYRRGRLIDVVTTVASYTLETHPSKNMEQSQWFVKCPICKRRIGLSI